MHIAEMPPNSALVIDDDRAIRTLVRTILTRQGFTVEEAAGGREAIARIEQQQYDVLLLDLMMTDGSGEDVLDALRVSRFAPRKCVIILSAVSAGKLAALESPNVAAKLRKPFDLDELVEAVRTCVFVASN